jgi:hypothetical protein
LKLPVGETRKWVALCLGFSETTHWQNEL